MFRCPVCRNVQPKGTRPKKIVLSLRRVVYDLGNSRTERGFEPVHETICCDACLKRLSRNDPVFTESKRVNDRSHHSSEQLNSGQDRFHNY